MRVALVLLAASAALWILLRGCAPPGGDAIAAAEWFVLGPRPEWIAIGDADGRVRWIDERGTERAAPSPPGHWRVVFPARGAPLLVGVAAERPDEPRVLAVGEDGAIVADTRLPLQAGEVAEPRLDGSAADGVLAADRLAVEVRRGDSVVAVLWYEPGAALVDRVDLESLGSLRLLSVPPDAKSMVAYRAPGAPDSSGALLVLSPEGEVRHEVARAEPLPPCWLPDLGGFLFARAGGGLSRFLPSAGEASFVCPGTFAAGVHRHTVARRDFDEPFVLVEKLDVDGNVQVTRVRPFAGQQAAQAQITTGGIDHYGMDCSLDHRFLAFRQGDLHAATEGGGGDVQERLVLLDEGRSFRATFLGDRRADPRDGRIGPRFSLLDDALYWVEDGRLRRLERP